MASYTSLCPDYVLWKPGIPAGVTSMDLSFLLLFPLYRAMVIVELICVVNNLYNSLDCM